MMMKSNLDYFGDRMTELFPRLMREFAFYESRYLKEGTLTLPQLWTLHYLHEHGQDQMNALAKWMRIRLSSTTGLVDRMVKNGLVRRYRTEEDRRAVYVEISPKGREILKDIMDQRRKGFMELFSRLTAEERITYLTMLEKMVKELSAEDEGRGKPVTGGERRRKK
jgi:MarR family transcriptional regulator, organic hydroperoxide resistance regulator